MPSLWLSSVVWLWYLSQKAWPRKIIALPWYPKKVNRSFADALASLRRQL
jgi:hypothetical protein